MVENPSRAEAMEMSLYFLVPFLGANLGYLARNWYRHRANSSARCPAECFGGDTLVYFGGMVFAVVVGSRSDSQAILSNLSKTLLVFMIPQAFNFVLSCPQLFGFVPCPRHRMPKSSPGGRTIEYTSFVFSRANGTRDKLGRVFIAILAFLGLAKVKRNAKTGIWESCNNLTLLNVILLWTGPISEARLALYVGLVQVLGSLIGFLIRYGIVHLVYNVA
ncbi:tunicamycin resistance protein [Kappamyces sp. JEL0829]|nr:tunicamycin resistance protein [Kappamyces sp. JEL0829]